MTRIAFALITAAALALASVPASAVPTLRPATTVAGPVIRLGDLFADAGAHADDAIAAAPAPGMHVTLSAEWLAAMAREHQLAWTPSSAYDQAVVARASRTIGADRVAAALLEETAARQPGDDPEILLDNPGLQFVVAADAPDALAIDGLTVDQRSGRLSAFVSAPAGDPAAVRQRVTGRLVYRLTVPVLTRALAPGATIAAGDLDVIKVRRDRLMADVATEAVQLLGKTPRRQLRAGEPLRLGDVQLPLLVHKGDLVTVTLETRSLQLTTQGKALDDGAKNALVRVENTKSSRVVDASVTGPGTVAAALPGGAPPALTAAR
jgi:flagella basal body P-ring formation protein FlgA